MDGFVKVRGGVSMRDLHLKSLRRKERVIKPSINVVVSGVCNKLLAQSNSPKTRWFVPKTSIALETNHVKRVYNNVTAYLTLRSTRFITFMHHLLSSL